MSEMDRILEEDDAEGQAEVPSLRFREVTSVSRARSKFKKRPKKRKMTKFERSYSKLAITQQLIMEEKRIDYVLVHDGKTPDQIEDKEDRDKLCKQELDRTKFEFLLKEQGFTIQKHKISNFVYTKLFCPFKRLCKEAELVKIQMPIKGCEKLDPVFTQPWYQTVLEKYFETDSEDDYISTQFIMNKINKFFGDENPNTFFRPAVRSFLVYHILINLDINTLDDDLKPKIKAEDESDMPEVKKGLPYMLMKNNYVDSYVLHEKSERGTVRGDNYFSGSAHSNTSETDPRKDLDETWTRPMKFQPLFKIRNYYGERIAFYFAWSGMLCTTLWIPTLFGLCVFIYGLYESATVDNGATNNATGLVNSFKDLFGNFKQSFDNGITPYFGLVICVWGTIFLEMWKRKNCELAYEWDVEDFEQNEPDRPSFKGTEPKKDPVTEEFVWYYPFKRQCIKFLLSFSVLIFMICLVLISVISIIMYRVIMNIDYCPGIDPAECLLLTTVLSSVLNAISILILSRIYNTLAHWLTEWENHRTQTKFDDALIFKLFAFQFVNSYASCFYIAFFRGKFDSVGFLNEEKYKDSCEGSCMTQLSFQILVLMLLKPVPKFLKDIILVWIKRIWRRNPNCCACLRKISFFSSSNQVSDGDVEKAARDGKNYEQLSEHLMFLKHEHMKPTLGDFTLDEYTEKIIQYGFLMLFATSFPLAPLLALLTNLFDLRVDAKRLLWWYRRPIAHVAQDIGMWYDILLFVNFAGVVSNAFLIAFTSSWGSKYDTGGKLIIVIAFEHIVFSLKYIVAYLIPDTPAHVSLAIRREQYQIQKKMEDPAKEMDFTHLFPVDNLDYGGTDSKDIGAGGDDPSNTHPNNNSTTPSHIPQPHLPTNNSKTAPLQPQKKSDGIVFTTKEGSFSEDDGLGMSRNSRVSASDVRPSGSKLWESESDIEVEHTPGMRAVSPNYPLAKMVPGSPPYRKSGIKQSFSSEF